jgi:hypothetical protein
MGSENDAVGKLLRFADILTHEFGPIELNAAVIFAQMK